MFLSNTETIKRQITDDRDKLYQASDFDKSRQNYKDVSFIYVYLLYRLYTINEIQRHDRLLFKLNFFEAKSKLYRLRVG